MKRLLVLIFLVAFASRAYVCMADSGLVRHPYMLGGLQIGKLINETHVGVRLGSYKPDLRELDRLLAQFGMDPPGASTMYSAFARLKGSPQLSYLLEIGYWANDVSTESMGTSTAIDVGATFTQLSLNFLYYPELIQEYMPLYLGIGGGIAHVNLTGSALALLSEVIEKRETTGLSGNFIAGLEYMILERMTLSVQANRIFKSIKVNEKGEQEFTFDGTFISIGVSGRF